MKEIVKALLPTLAMLALMAGIGLYLYFQHSVVNWGSYAAIALFYATVFFIGSYASRYKKDNSTEEVLVAGRNVPLWIGLFTMAATWIDGTYINGTAELTMKSGLVWVQAPWGYALSLIIGGIFFARPMHRRGYKTMLDPIEHRFGHLVTSLSFIPALLGEIFWTAAVLTALGTTFSAVIGLPFEVAIIISAFITIIYTMLGGLWAVAYTDVFQLLFLFAGLYIIVPFALQHTGGLGVVWEAYALKKGNAASLLPAIDGSMGNYLWNWIDYALLLIFGGIPWQVYFQRVLSARSPNAAMWLSIGAGILCILAAIPSGVLGIIGDVTDWQAVVGIPAPDAVMVVPSVIRYLTPPIIATLGLAVIAAAVMSSTDASMVSAASMASWNIWHRIFRPQSTAADLSVVIKRSILVVGVTATALAIQVRSVASLWILCSDLIYCVLFPVLVVALFDKKANRYGVLAGMGVAFFLRIGGGEPAFGLPHFLPYPMFEDGIVLFPFRTLAMVSGLLTILLISRLTQKQCPPIAL